MKKRVCSPLELTNEHYLILYFTIIYIIQSIYTHSIDISFLFHSYFIHVLCGKEELSMSAREHSESGIVTQVSSIKYQDTRHLTFEYPCLPAGRQHPSIRTSSI
jgi:hypothetical protein